MHSKTIAFASLFMFGAIAPARADDTAQLERQVAELQKEVRELRAMWKVMIELDRQKLEMITRLAGSESKPAVSLEAVPTEGAPATAPEPTSDKGTVSGRVRVPDGALVAYVYVENAGTRLAHGKTVELKQSNHQFDPRWAVIQQGTEIRFPNVDSTYHNVFSRSPLASFDLGIYRAGDAPRSYTFNKAGVIDIFCNMHAEMTAQLLVVPNAFYAKVADDGSFTIANVPKGKRKIVAWSPHAPLAEKWVVVDPTKKTEVTLELAGAAEKPHLDKNGRPYGSYRQ
jgi:plastocyanin